MPAFQSFRAVRWVRTLNLILQAVLFLSFFGGLNYLALHHAWRYDLTHHRRYSLSPETLSYLSDLKRPVRVIVTLSEDSENPEIVSALRDIRGLLREYVYATEANPGGKVTAEYIDVNQRRREAEQLGIDQPNTILLLCGDRRRLVPLSELYRIKRTGPTAEREAFQGEQAITAALLDVSNPSRKKIYFLAGHAEMRPDDSDPNRGLSTLAAELRLRNLDVERLDVMAARGIPEDAALIVAAAPQSVEPYVQEQLRQYLSTRAGRVILMLAPALPHRLDELLYDWGIQVDDNVIYDPDPQNVTESGDLVLLPFAPHPVTRTLIDWEAPLVIPQARSVRPDPGRSSSSGLSVTTLVATAPSAWGESNYRQGGVPQYNIGSDLKGFATMEPAHRLGVVVASERVAARDNLPFSVPRGRLVVFGTADLVSNNRLSYPGNHLIFMNAVNWALDRDTQLAFPARPIERFQLSLSEQQFLRLRYSLLLILPGCVAMLGLAVYWSRRK